VATDFYMHFVCYTVIKVSLIYITSYQNFIFTFGDTKSALIAFFYPVVFTV